MNQFKLAQSALTRSTLAVLATFFVAGSGQALTVDFEDIVHGGDATGTHAGLVTISASNPNRGFDLAVGFDSHERNTSDMDLEALHFGTEWCGGNLVDTFLGTMLILQENNTGCADGVCDDPDDEGRRPAGQLSFDFSTAVSDFGFDAVDIESATAEEAFIRFHDGSDSVEISLMEYVTATGDFYDATIVLGDNNANRFAAISASELGLSKFDRVEFTLGGSGALDNIVVTPVPEPSTALMIGLGLGGLALRRRAQL